MVDVYVVDENGITQSGPVAIPGDLREHFHDTRFQRLRFVDPYGDTTFNALQVPALLEGIALLRQSIDNSPHGEIADRLESLCKLATCAPYTYVKFIGD